MPRLLFFRVARRVPCASPRDRCPLSTGRDRRPLKGFQRHCRHRYSDVKLQSVPPSILAHDKLNNSARTVGFAFALKIKESP
eukprot:6195919-Pleurochrysis_carterae.AAC.2